MAAVRPLALLTILLVALFGLKGLSLLNGAQGLFESVAEARVSPETPQPQPEPETSEVERAYPDDVQPQGETPPPAASSQAAAATGYTPAPSRSMDGLLTALAERRRALDQREAELDTRESFLEVAEGRVNDRISQLQSLEADVQALLGQLDAQRQAELDAMVATFSGLEPDSAAIILRSLNEVDADTMLLVATELQNGNARKFAAIMGELADLDPLFAARLTSMMRARSMPPATLAELEASRGGAQR